MQHLTIDIGNTATKAAIHIVMEGSGSKRAGDLQPTEPLLLSRVDGHQFHWIADFCQGYALDACIISSTVGISDTFRQQISRLNIPHVHYLTAATPIPIHNAYTTPDTLGTDRLAAAIGAYYESQRQTGTHRPVLIIDAGTAITYDLITATGRYIGGNISPGIHLRLQSLHEHTAQLPLVTLDNPQGQASPFAGKIADDHADSIVGNTTDSAILHGVLDGVRHEIEGFICEFSLKYPDIFVFLTGGDQIRFSVNIKNRIFADEFLVSKGLDLILQHIERLK